jgi:hypothetical protein
LIKPFTSFELNQSDLINLDLDSDGINDVFFRLIEVLSNNKLKIEIGLLNKVEASNDKKDSIFDLNPIEVYNNNKETIIISIFIGLIISGFIIIKIFFRKI